MSEPQNRKLVAMATANLVAAGRPEVLDRLSGDVLNLWIDVFGELKEALREDSSLSNGYGLFLLINMILNENVDGFSSSLTALVTFWRDSSSGVPRIPENVRGKPEYDRWVEVSHNLSWPLAKLTTTNYTS